MNAPMLHVEQTYGGQSIITTGFSVMGCRVGIRVWNQDVPRVQTAIEALREPPIPAFDYEARCIGLEAPEPAVSGHPKTESIR
jgi:hypothetical protein